MLLPVKALAEFVNHCLVMSDRLVVATLALSTLWEAAVVAELEVAVPVF